MEISFDMKGKPATPWLAFRCRYVNIHTMRKRVFPNDSCGKSPT